MTEKELRTLAAAVIIGGQYAGGDSVRRDVMVREAILTAEALLEALENTEPLEKRIDEFSEKRRTYTPPKPDTGWYPKDRYRDGQAWSVN